MNAQTSWFSLWANSFFQRWQSTLNSTQTLTQIAVLVGIFLFLLPLGILLAWMYRRLLQQTQLTERIVLGWNRVRAFFLQPPLTEEACSRLEHFFASLEVTTKPLSGYLLLQLSLLALPSFGIAKTPWLQHVSPLFLLWGIYLVLIECLWLFACVDTAHFLHRRFFRPAIFLCFFLQLTGYLPTVFGWLNSPMFSIVGVQISIQKIVLALLLLWLFFRLAHHSRSWVKEGLMPKLHTPPALGNTIATFFGYVVVGFGFFFALSTLGFQGTSFALLLVALAVGIGFGLQGFINNLVSGLILLAEQSIAPGDVVELEKDICVVENIHIRNTIVRTQDNIQLNVPNNKLLRDIVRNYTGGDTAVRTSIRVGVSYKSDPNRAKGALLRAAEETKGLLRHPPPTVTFVDFGADALLFDLLVWVQHPRQIPTVTSSLRFSVWYKLKEVGIEIPHSQREVHLGLGWDKLNTANLPPDASPPHPAQASVPYEIPAQVTRKHASKTRSAREQREERTRPLRALSNELENRAPSRPSLVPLAPPLPSSTPENKTAIDNAAPTMKPSHDELRQTKNLRSVSPPETTSDELPSQDPETPPSPPSTPPLSSEE